MEITNIAFVNFTGYTTSTSRSAEVSCSNVHPCYNVVFQNFTMALGINATEVGAKGTCSYIASGGVNGLSGSGC
jgi:galacturan 1,4-alpha-galacturonidase